MHGGDQGTATDSTPAWNVWNRSTYTPPHLRGNAKGNATSYPDSSSSSGLDRSTQARPAPSRGRGGGGSGRGDYDILNGPGHGAYGRGSSSLRYEAPPFEPSYKRQHNDRLDMTKKVEPRYKNKHDDRFAMTHNLETNSKNQQGDRQLEPNQSDDRFDITQKFEELQVTEVADNVAENGAINFDAYEDIPVEASGDNIPPAVHSFAELDLGDGLIRNIQKCSYVKPTPIQRHAIPISVAGRDLMACAQTGSGKTAAFCLPIISGILKNRTGSGGRGGGGGARIASPLALILSPTRELSCQIHEEAKKFAQLTGVKVVVIYGGAPISQQLRELERGVDILVATPGRLVDMIERERVSLRKIKYLALDEADRMLDMGFEHQIRNIVEEKGMPTPGARQTMLFSATFPDEIQKLASDFLKNYIFLSVGRVGSSTDLIAQRVEYVEDGDKRNQLMALLGQEGNGSNGKRALTLVFVETKRGADALERCLDMNGFSATAIHGDKVQMERERALRSFKTGRTPIMVATDVASRGLDIPHVSLVVNFDMPKNIDDYVHRIGRTGRAGKSGLATAFFNEKNLSLAKPLLELMKEAKQEVPSWLGEYAENSSYSGGNQSRSYRGNKFGGYDYRSSAKYGSYTAADHYNAGAGSYAPYSNAADSWTINDNNADAWAVGDKGANAWAVNDSGADAWAANDNGANGWAANNDNGANGWVANDNGANCWAANDNCADGWAANDKGADSWVDPAEGRYYTGGGNADCYGPGSSEYGSVVATGWD